MLACVPQLHTSYVLHPCPVVPQAHRPITTSPGGVRATATHAAHPTTHRAPAHPPTANQHAAACDMRYLAELPAFMAGDDASGSFAQCCTAAYVQHNSTLVAQHCQQAALRGSFIGAFIMAGHGLHVQASPRKV